MERIINFRSDCAITDSRHVIAVDYFISIHITILNISRIDRSEALRQTVGYIICVFKETYSFQTINLVQRVAGLYKIIVHSRFLQLFLNLIPVPVEATSSIQHHISHTLRVIKAELAAPTVYHTGVLIRRSLSQDSRVLTFGRNPDVVSTLIICVYRKIQPFKQRGVYTDIVFISFLMRIIRTCQTAEFCRTE